MLVYDIDEKKVKNLVLLDTSDLSSESDIIPLLSITTAYEGTFKKGSKYFNNEDNLIYTAVNDNTWEGAKTSEPKFGIIYQYDGIYYQWDGDSFEESDLNKYQLKANITDEYNTTSVVTYPSSKALKDGLDSIIQDKTYIHEQGISSDTWKVQHNLNKKPSVTVTDTYNRVIESQIDYIDNNNVVIKLNASFKGFAYFN